MLKDTIISAFNYDGTLLKWLKKVQDALQNASASEFRVNKKGNATISFSIVFANGDTLESGDIILQQGESVTGATIRQGHLILTLSNGNELDAGDVGAVTGFSINGSQHLIVTYQNGTTQDLGAIFNGNVNVNGNFTANSIIENMSGYSFSISNTENLTKEVVYAGVVKNGNKITFAIAINLTRTGTVTGYTHDFGNFTIPSTVGSKLYTTRVDDYDFLSVATLYAYKTYASKVELPSYVSKPNNTYISARISSIDNLELNVKYYTRLEVTYLLSDNLAG